MESAICCVLPNQREDVCEDIIVCVRAFRTVPGVAVAMEVNGLIPLLNSSSGLFYQMVMNSVK